MSFVIDMTERKRAEEKLRASEQRFLDAQMELAHVTRVTTLGELAASIAHEVNQPLAAVVANAEACLRWLDRETPDLDEARRSVEWIIDDGNRASEVIRRVRALAKKTDIEKVPLDINDLVKEVIALVQRELISHGVSLRMEFAPALPMILADRVQLQQVIINLVMNGIEAMQPVTDRPRELVIRSGQDEHRPSAGKCDGLRRRDLRRECGPAVQRLLHHQIQRHGYGALDLPFDHGSPRWPAVGRQQCAPGCHVSVHVAIVSRGPVVTGCEGTGIAKRPAGLGFCWNSAQHPVSRGRNFVISSDAGVVPAPPYVWGRRRAQRLLEGSTRSIVLDADGSCLSPEAWNSCADHQIKISAASGFPPG